MGADIHLAVEIYLDGAWKNVIRDEPITYYGNHKTKEWYSGRNYVLFAALADVRNASPGEEGWIPPISEPRGFPDDIDLRTVEPWDELNADGADPYRNDGKADGDHSESWLLLSEVLTWPVWTKPADRDEYLIRMVAGQLEYREEVAERCASFLEVMRELKDWAQHKHGLAPDRVRLVYNFDN